MVYSGLIAHILEPEFIWVVGLRGYAGIGRARVTNFILSRVFYASKNYFFFISRIACNLR